MSRRQALRAKSDGCRRRSASPRRTILFATKKKPPPVAENDPLLDEGKAAPSTGPANFLEAYLSITSELAITREMIISFRVVQLTGIQNHAPTQTRWHRIALGGT